MIENDSDEPDTVASKLARTATQVVSLLRQAQTGTDPGDTAAGMGTGPPTAPGLAAIHRARELRRHADTALHVTVERARDSGHTWHEIGAAIGTSRQAAFQRFGRPIDPRTGESMNDATLPDADTRTTALFGDWADGDYESVAAAGLDATMAAQLSVDTIGANWARIVGMVGAYERMGEPFVRGEGDYTVVDLPLYFEAGEMKGRAAFNSAGEVSGLFILTPDTP